MQRYTAASINAGINSNAIGGTSGRENARAESSFSSSNYPLNSRRQPQLAPFKLKCDKEPLNNRLGPPDFYPQTPNCPEETLTKEYVQSGYKETVEGIEEAREIVLTQIPYFNKPDVVLKCKEAIKRRFRAINESRAQKRKAGQVYGVPLSGSLLIKPGVFPEQRPCGEDFRRKWIEALAQQHKRLRSLSEHVPHGYRRKSLFDVLTRYNVPLLRATWFVKVTYLNQVRPSSNSISTGGPDKSQVARTDQWTKDIVEYLQHLLDEFCLKDGFVQPPSSRDQPSPGLIAGVAPGKHRNESSTAISDAEEPSLHSKWCYMVHLFQWHLTEGLLLPSFLIEWVFNQLQEKDSAEALELLLPVVLGLVDSITLSQTYVRMFVEIFLRRLSDVPCGSLTVIGNSKKASTAAAVAEILRYMILAVPDVFVSLDCFPLPSFVAPNINSRGALLKLSDGGEIANFERQEAFRYLSCGHAVSVVQTRSSNLAKIANPNFHGRGAAKVVQALDKALITGSLTSAYTSLFDDLSDSLMEERWIAEVSPCLQSSLLWIGAVELSLICSVFFLCEWATCDYRDCRTALPQNVKLTGRKDLSQIYVAVSLLKYKMDEMNNLSRSRSSSRLAMNNSAKNASLNDSSLGATVVENASGLRSNTKNVDGKKNKKDIFESPGPLHDIVVCWLDQHEVSNAAGFTRVDVLIMELIRSGIFNPEAYVRQLIISGITDRNGTLLDLERRRRHRRILKQLPGSCLFDVLEEARIAEDQLLYESVSTYTSERQLVLRELSSGQSCDVNNRGEYPLSLSIQKRNDYQVAAGDAKHGRLTEQVADVKALISSLLHFPIPSLSTEQCLGGNKANLKRPASSIDSQVDFGEAKAGCEECRRTKRQKLDEQSSPFQGIQLFQSDEEDIWWLRKGPKLHETFKLEPPQKSIKQPSRGRAKVVRKTQSLAQLAAARIESSQGASTSHVCDSKMSCPHHKSGTESENLKDADRTKMANLTDIGKALKRLRLLERRSISIWLLKSIRQLVEGHEMAASKASSSASVFSSQSDDKSAAKWRLGEDGLLSVLYVLDTCCDLVSAARFLIWLLPKIRGGMSTSAQVGRNVMQAKNRENQACQFGEAFLFSSLLRYENVLVAMDLLPEVLSASMNRNVVVMSNGRHPGSVAFAYTRYFLKKYREVASVTRWEKNFRTTCDQRLLAELDNGRSIDGDSISSSGISAEEIDEHIRQKLNGRNSRTVANMKEIVQRPVEDASRNFSAKEKKNFTAPKGISLEKWEDSYQIAHNIVLVLVECIRQNGGGSPDGDPSVVASAVSAIVSNVGPAMAKLPDFTGGNYQGVPSSVSSFNWARHILNIHITSLCLLKDALGERFSRMFEIALAVEASSAVAVAFAPPKVHRNQFQPSPETHDVYGNHSNELPNNLAKGFVGRAAKVAIAISALVVGAIVHGVVSLERMIAVLKLKEGLDVLQFIRSSRTSTNGVSRSIGTFKLDHCTEVCVHWFRLLVGDCRSVCDGLVADILGESCVLALSRMQRMLPLTLVFPPAYSIFAMVLWRPYILNSNMATREDVQLYQYLSSAIGDIIKHQPFRDLCFRNTHVFYDLLASDVGDSEFAAMLELHSPDKHSKAMAFIPLRGRLFLNALVDCKLPTVMLEDGSCVSEPREARASPENEPKLLERLLQILDTLQPAKFHWQWVELRLLLDEQALIERVGTQKMSFVEALRSLSPNAENFALSESEKGFTEIILSRLLVRPDAASLYSEVVHLLGKLQESLVVDIKWILQGQDVLLGRKSIRQQLVYVAQRKGLPTKPQVWKPWGWSSSIGDIAANKGAKRKLEVTSIEEGEVVDECIDAKKPVKNHSQNTDKHSEGLRSIYQHVTEKALTELMLPCIDRSSGDLRSLFATELIKQMGIIEQHINAIVRNGMKQSGSVSSGNEGSLNKASSRKGMRGGSPIIGRRPPVVNDSTPPSAVALRASLWLRLQFLIRLLPVIFADREPSPRNMRQMLASIILRLLGTRVVYEDAELSLPPIYASASRRDVESLPEPSLDVLFDRLGETLFERLLCVLHALLGTCKPSWLKPKATSKSTVKSPRDFSAFDREAAESMQSDLDRMELPATIRRRIQAAMPFLPSSRPLSIPCHPPLLSLPALAPFQSSTTTTGPHHRNVSTNWIPTNVSSRSKAALPSQDPDLEIDPWTLLEDGTSCGSTSSGSSSMGGITADHSNLKACSWLKGAVRVRRTDLTYIGSLDDDS